MDVAAFSRNLIKPNHCYQPNPENQAVYERSYQVFRRLYKSNAANFSGLN